jgi:hypothetical protein
VPGCRLAVEFARREFPEGVGDLALPFVGGVQ